MKKITLTALFAILMGLLIFTGCQKMNAPKPLVPNQTTYTYHTTAYQTAIQNGGDNTPFTNQLTDAGANLGRLLFYDPRLSVNNTIACASCHKQQFAFADNIPQSHGVNGNMTIRNTPAIINEMNKSVFFWDGRVNSLETQTGMPIQNHLEMGLEQIEVLPQKLATATYYASYFQNAFGSPQITPARISQALAQFVRAIASTQSPSDQRQLTGDALAGENLFFGKYQCAHCHTGTNMGGAPLPQFGPYGGGTTDSGGQQSTVLTVQPNTSNIGLDVVYTDQGTEAITGVKSQNGYFVIPSLRNVALTAPYMHDGRFATLSQVIDHYSDSIQPHPDLDPFLYQSNFAQGMVTKASGTPVKMNISAQEKQQLIAFLTALSDQTIASDPKFSNPY
jgi:cytochrome c peroxidase